MIVEGAHDAAARHAGQAAAAGTRNAKPAGAAAAAASPQRRRSNRRCPAIFIDRPIFAWVIAIIVMLAGVGAILSLPVAQYPDIAPPQVTIRATYPGAAAQTLENTSTQVIEQQLTGIDGLLYFSSIVDSRGHGHDHA